MLKILWLERAATKDAPRKKVTVIVAFNHSSVIATHEAMKFTPLFTPDNYTLLVVTKDTPSTRAQGVVSPSDRSRIVLSLATLV